MLKELIEKRNAIQDKMQAIVDKYYQLAKQ